MATPNFFDAEPFQLVSLGRWLDKQKTTPGQASRFFMQKPAITSDIWIESRTDGPALIQTNKRGAPPSQEAEVLRSANVASIPQIQRADTINASELVGVRAYGMEGQLMALTVKRDERMARILRKINATKEHLCLGGLRGTVLDADGSSTVLDCFALMGVAAVAEVNVDWANASETVPLQNVETIKRTIYNALGDLAPFVDHIHCFESPEFADARRLSAAYRNTFKFDMASEELRRDRLFDTVDWIGVQWEEYRLGNSGLSAGNFLAADKALFFPVLRGDASIFELYYAPGDFLDAYDEPGRPEYVKTARDPEFDRWLKLYVQSNPLPVNVYPEAVVPADK